MASDLSNFRVNKAKRKKATAPGAKKTTHDIMSPAFADDVTDAFSHATKAAIAKHHAQGKPVHGVIDGEAVEVKAKAAETKDHA